MPTLNITSGFQV